MTPIDDSGQWQARALDAERRVKKALEHLGDDEVDEAVLVLEGETPPEGPTTVGKPKIGKLKIGRGYVWDEKSQRFNRRQQDGGANVGGQPRD